MKNFTLIFTIAFVLLQSCQQQNKIDPIADDLAIKSGAYASMKMMSHKRAYPNQDIPPGAFYAGYETHINMSVQHRSFSDPWEAKGPLNTAGRCLSVEVDPIEPNTIYAGTASGGLWKSESLGLNADWERIDTGFPVLGVSDIEFVPEDNQTLYIGTGEVYSTLDSGTGTDGAFRVTRGSYGIGILKSTDGGQTWEKSLDWTYQNERGVWMIKIHPTNHDIVYAATTEGVFKTENAGQDWVQVLDVIMATDIIINKASPNQVLISSGNFDSEGKGIYKSIDDGETWMQIDGGLTTAQNGKTLLAESSDPNIVYASIGNGFGFDDGASWLYRSSDFGNNWDLITVQDYSRWQGWFAHDLAINPNDTEELVVVGIDVWKVNGTQVERTSNGGVTFGAPPILGPDGPPDYSHSDHHFVTYHPSIDDLVILGNDGGVFISRDNGNSFESANGGMQTTQFYNGFSVSPDDPNFALGGLQDNSTVIFTGNDEWTRDVGGDGSWTAINQDNTNIIYASSQNLRILRSNNGGQSFSRINNSFLNDEFSVFIAPYVLAPSMPDRLYIGSNYLKRSDDRGDNFETMNGGFPISSNAIFAMAVSPTDEDIVYFGTGPLPSSVSPEEPQLFISTDGGETIRNTSTDLPNRIVNDICIHPENPAIAYATFSGFGTSHLFRTENFGESWTPIDSGLPDLPGNAIVVNPFNPQQIYYGNDIGVYISNDEGQSWEVWSDGLPNACIIMDLKISMANESIWVATHGSGTYERELNAIDVSTDDIEKLSIALYPNPTSDILKFDLENNIAIFQIEIFDLLGRTILDVESSQNTVDVSYLPSGEYILQLKSKDNIYQEKFVKL